MNEVNLSESEVLKGLSFYGIDDSNYLNSTLECLDFINKNEDLKQNVIHIYKKLYNNITSLIRPLWKKKELGELFGNNLHPFLTNLILLLGFSVHDKNMALHNFDEYQVNVHKKRVKEALTNDIYNRNLPGIRLSQMLWGVYFVNTRIIEVGRLQYEYYEDDLEKSIRIHIPAGEKLDIEDVISSLKNAPSAVLKYFGASNLEYYCHSWLLSKQISEVVNSDSNILKFQSLFDISEGDDCYDDILNFVFKIKTIDNLENLEERTSLERNIKSSLLKGNKFYLGIGKLKKLD